MAHHLKQEEKVSDVILSVATNPDSVIKPVSVVNTDMVVNPDVAVNLDMTVNPDIISMVEFHQPFLESLLV